MKPGGVPDNDLVSETTLTYPFSLVRHENPEPNESDDQSPLRIESIGIAVHHLNTFTINTGHPISLNVQPEPIMALDCIPAHNDY